MIRSLSRLPWEDWSPSRVLLLQYGCNVVYETQWVRTSVDEITTHAGWVSSPSFAQGFANRPTNSTWKSRLGLLIGYSSDLPTGRKLAPPLSVQLGSVPPQRPYTHKRDTRPRCLPHLEPKCNTVLGQESAVGSARRFPEPRGSETSRRRLYTLVLLAGGHGSKNKTIIVESSLTLKSGV